MIKELNLEEMLFGKAARVRNVIRFGNCQRLHEESVAEHSWFTCYYSFLLGRAVGLDDYDMSMLLQKSIIHDLEESVSGDYPREFKYSSPEITKSLKLAGEKAFETCMKNLVPDGEAKELFGMWKTAKDESKIGRILALADFLSVLSYLCGELTNNRTMKENRDEMKKYWTSFAGPEYDFLRSFVNEAGAILGKAML